ncbi:MAG: glycosyltransferase family 2 protein [Pseudomonadota bacterium]
MAGVDILIPHFRDPEGLRISLESIAAQTWTGDMRVVLVDDGSEPEFYQEIEAQAEAFPLPVTLERNPVNRGRPYTRNRLLDGVDNPFVAWLDAGDTWYPEKLEKQFEQISRLRYIGEDADRYWITCHYDWQWEGRRARQIEQQTDVRQMRELMLGQKLRAYLWTLLGTAKAFKIAGRFDERLPRLQDLDYFVRFVLAGGILTVPRRTGVLCKYHKSDVGRNAQEIRACNHLIYRKYRPHLEAYGPSFLKTIRYNADMLSARFARNNGAPGQNLYYIGRATLAHPKRAIGAARFHLRKTQESA